MTLEDELNLKLKQAETIFKEEIESLHLKIIDGSPVDKGHFKTSWQILEFEPSEWTFRMINPVKYGVGLWRYGKSKQGWSPRGGDELVMETERRINERTNNI